MSGWVCRHAWQAGWVLSAAMLGGVLVAGDLGAAPRSSDTDDTQEAQAKFTKTSGDASEDVNVKRLEEQMDEILRVQETILSQYDEILEGLRIAKVRVSR